MTKWYTFWISMPGIVVSSSSVLTTMLVINAIYLTFKCRQMAITLAVLKEHVLSAKAEEVIILDYFKKSNTCWRCKRTSKHHEQPGDAQNPD